MIKRFVRSLWRRRRRLLEIGGVHLLGGPDLTLVDPLGKSQRVQGLVQVVLSRRQVDEHQGLGVAPQRVDQEVRQLRIPIGDVSVLENKDYLRTRPYKLDHFYFYRSSTGQQIETGSN